MGICTQTGAAIFRSARDGRWDWIGPYIVEKAVPIDLSKRQALSAEAMAEARTVGQQFLDAMHIDRQCVVLTGIPNSYTDAPAIAAQLAADLGTQSLFLDLRDLTTVDEVHLNKVSAERWSEAFTAALTPILERCLLSSATR